MNRFASLAVAAVTLFAVACSAADSADGEASQQDLTQEAGAPAGAPLADNLQWFRNSAEARASYLQAYRLAAMSLDATLAERKETGPWAVVFDTDETILDNSEYQKERGPLGRSNASWSAWVQRKQAKALPGSVAFMKHVQEKGGKVAIVTNRITADCAATQENIHAVGLVFDVILCLNDPKGSDKNPRFDALKAGTAQPGLPALDILMWVGDSITDFPALTEAARTDETKLADFSTRYVILPNPMYGSWTTNPRD